MNDLRLAFRQILRQPGFSFLAAFSLALGIGLVLTQFSLIDAILLRGLPIPGAQRLVHVARYNPQTPDAAYWETVPPGDYLHFREHQSVLEDIAAVNTAGFNLTGRERMPTHHLGARVSANLLSVLGSPPAQGRWFDAGEDQPGQPLRIVLSHGLWQEEFGADPHALGRSLSINGEPGIVIGIMPPGFDFPARVRLWTNLRPVAGDPRELLTERVEMVGKRLPGVSLRQTRTALDTLARQLEQAYPETHRGYSRMHVDKFTFAYAEGPTRPILYLLLLMTLLILALASLNVANMLLMRASRRTRELAVRAALGASRWRITRQLLLESLVLAVAGALIGLLFARIGIDQLDRQFVGRMGGPDWFVFRLDHRLAVVALAITLLAGLVAGIIPALKAGRIDVQAALKDESRGASSLTLGRLSRWLVTAQITFATALLVAACFLAWSVVRMQRLNQHHDPHRLLSGRIELHEATHPQPADRARFYRELLQRLEGIPGVRQAAISSRNLVHTGVFTRVISEGSDIVHENEQPQAWLEVVSDSYFSLLETLPITGRIFDGRDTADAPRTAVVNESFARRMWPGADPIGKRFRSSQTQDHWVVVVGMVPDLQIQGLFAPPFLSAAGFYLAQEQMGWGWLHLLVRTEGDPSDWVESVRQVVASIDPDQPVHSIGTLAAQTAREIHGFNIVGFMAGIFAGTTLFLGAVGVYGVTSFAVGQRTREFGVRIALGASSGSIVRHVLRQGALQVLAGLATGLVLGILVTRPMMPYLGTTLSQNLEIPGVVGLIITAVAGLALWIPTRRASRVDPMVALRAE